MDGCFSWLFHLVLPDGISYTEAKRRIRSFDLLYFCQLGTWTGPFVALISGKMVTHMGVAYRDPQSGELYVLESVRHADTACDVADHDRRVHTGVRLVSLSGKLNDTRGRYFVCVQPVLMEPRIRERAEAAFPEFIRKHVNIPFEQHPLCFLTAHLNRAWWGYTREDTKSLFCSELVALALRECGLLPGVDNVSAVWHTYFWCNQVMLTPGATLSAKKFMIAMNREQLTTNVAAAAAVLVSQGLEQSAPPPVLARIAAAAASPPPPRPTETGDEMVARIRALGVQMQIDKL